MHRLRRVDTLVDSPLVLEAGGEDQPVLTVPVREWNELSSIFRVQPHSLTRRGLFRGADAGRHPVGECSRCMRSSGYLTRSSQAANVAQRRQHDAMLALDSLAKDMHWLAPVTNHLRALMDLGTCASEVIQQCLRCCRVY